MNISLQSSALIKHLQESIDATPLVWDHDLIIDQFFDGAQIERINSGTVRNEYAIFNCKMDQTIPGAETVEFHLSKQELSDFIRHYIDNRTTLRMKATDTPHCIGFSSPCHIKVAPIVEFKSITVDGKHITFDVVEGLEA